MAGNEHGNRIIAAGPAAAGKFVLQLHGQAGVPYQLQTSTNLVSWTSNSTVTLTDSSWSTTNSVSPGVKFWRAVWLP